MEQGYPGIPQYDNVVLGNPFQPKPRGIAHELWYWKESEGAIDIPIPKDFQLLRKYDRLNSPLDYPYFSKRVGR